MKTALTKPIHVEVQLPLQLITLSIIDAVRINYSENQAKKQLEILKMCTANPLGHIKWLLTIANHYLSLNTFPNFPILACLHGLLDLIF